jgi:hypothetical protein
MASREDAATPSGGIRRIDEKTLPLRPRADGREVFASQPKPRTQSFRHEFLVETVKSGGWFDVSVYRYFCIHCRWTFVLSTRPLSRKLTLVALDEHGGQLSDPEHSRRTETFFVGPCLY